MTTVDVVVAAVALAIGLRGLFRGLIREVLGLAAWLGGSLGATWLSRELGAFAARYMGTPVLFGKWVAFAGSFLAIYVACRIAGWLLTRLAQSILLGGLNRLGGFAFGTAKALVVSALFLYVIHYTRNFPNLKERIDASASGPVLIAGVDRAVEAIREAVPEPESGRPTPAAPAGTPPKKAGTRQEP